MFRVCAALAAALLVPGIAPAQELKPKFGNIDGVYYTDVAENREACRQAIKNKIALCRQNTSFVSNTEDRKYPGCLPLFRRQAGACADHFRSEAHKCQGSGSARIADFTGFACTVTATVVEEGEEPEGNEPERGTGSREPAQRDRDPAARLSPKCAGMGKGAKCWQELANKPGCYFFEHFYRRLPEAHTWSGACKGGVAAGRGTLRGTSRGAVGQTGAMVRGKRQGKWLARGSAGLVSERSYSDGREHGRWVIRESGGLVHEFLYVRGKLHGKAVTRSPDGSMFEFNYLDDKRHGRYLSRTGRGYVTEGRYANDKKHGTWVYRGPGGKCYSRRYDRGARVPGSHRKC